MMIIGEGPVFEGTLTLLSRLHRPVLLALLLPLFSATVFAAPEYPVLTQRSPCGEPPLFELPDNYKINQACEEVDKKAIQLELYWADSDFDAYRLNGVPTVSLRGPAHEVQSLIAEAILACDSRPTNGPARDDWWLRYIARSNRLYELADWCANCMSCRLSPSQPLPLDYPAYAIFLWPNYEFNRAQRDYAVKLHAVFHRFGESIGPRGAAVWFSIGLGRVDVDRSKFYCDLFGLSYNRGPYVVVTSHRPDEESPGNHPIVIRLTDLPPERAVRVLNILEQDLRRGMEIKREPLLFEEIKQRMFSAVDRNQDLLKDIVTELVGR